MKNAELLFMQNPKGNGLLFNITVASYTTSGKLSYTMYGYAEYDSITNRPKFGDVTPSAIGGYTLSSVYSSTTVNTATSVQFIPDIDANTIVVSRLDTGLSVTVPRYVLSDGTVAAYFTHATEYIFTQSDVGKTIPIMVELA